MTIERRQLALYGIIAAAGIAAPFLFPNYTLQITVMWVMILFAVTWDILGGQMGYNSLGNIFFFGVGMYTSAIVQIGLVYDVAKYASPSGVSRRNSRRTNITWGWCSGSSRRLSSARYLP